MDLGKLTLRVVVGGLFVGHGLQKLNGSFGGPGLEGASGFMESLGLKPGRRNALAASLSETVGGAALALGAGTPLAAAALIGSMTTAIRKVHLPNGVWNTGGGYEYNLVLIAAAAALTADGPGRLSLDALVGRSRWGLGWGIAALVAGVLGSAGVIAAGKNGDSDGAAGAPSGEDVSTDDPAEGATAESADAAI